MTSQASVMIFWDYDTQWGADRSRGEGGPKDWGILEFENTDRLLEIHADFALSSCFAIVGAAALPGEHPYHDPAQIRRIHAEGHEVASHSFKHEWLPALGPGELRETLRRSKDALEQCTGSAVHAFVPPFNQPFDFPAGGSFSFSERLSVRGPRTDLRRLCEALHETGYSFCRVSHQALLGQIWARLLRRERFRPSEVQRIAGLRCVKMNTPGGFGERARAVLERGVTEGGIWVLYGHPHSISNPRSAQAEAEVLQAFRMISRMRDRGEVRCILPRDLVGKQTA